MVVVGGSGYVVEAGGYGGRLVVLDRVVINRLHGNP